MKLKFSRNIYLCLLIFIVNPLFSSCSYQSKHNMSSIIQLNPQDFDISKQEINYDMIKKTKGKKFDEQIRARVIGLSWVYYL